MNLPDKTGEKQGQWRSRQSGNPAGRPRGALNKYSESFLATFGKDFEEHGAEVIQRVRAESPCVYLRVAATIFPKRLELERADAEKDAERMTDDELEALIWRTHKNLINAGIEQPISEGELADARARRVARGN